MMPIGRKPTRVKMPVISAPPQVTNVEFISPLGDQYGMERQDNKQIADATLSPLTAHTIRTSQEALLDLANEFYAPDSERVQDIADKSLDYFELQAQGINTQADDILSQAQSDLSKRFGGTYNATFGADYLSRLENNRLTQLSNAAKEAALVAEEMYSRDEDSRMRRFGLLSDYLSGEFDKASTVWELGANLLQEDANRAQSLATARANLAQNAMRYNQESQLKARQQRLNLMQALMNAGSRVISAGIS
jgi:hypothetical protein